jgi:hypothetical protein
MGSAGRTGFSLLAFGLQKSVPVSMPTSKVSANEKVAICICGMSTASTFSPLMNSSPVPPNGCVLMKLNLRSTGAWGSAGDSST